MSSNACGTSIDHSVTMVGFDDVSGKSPYWTIKNSWGTGWGLNGYMNILKDMTDRKSVV